MKRYLKTVREYPKTALMCFIADIAVTARFTDSRCCMPDAVKYFIMLYGAFMGVLIFTAGWTRAKDALERKEAVRRREMLRKKLHLEHSREFYGITEFSRKTQT